MRTEEVHSNVLGAYEDWPDFLATSQTLSSGDGLSDRVAQVLGVRRASVRDLRTDSRWSGDGVRTHRVSWALPYGPRTTAYVVEPEAARHEPRPAVLALHCHGGVRSTGAQQLVDVEGDPRLERDGAREPAARVLQTSYYDGLAPATELARQGFVVLAHDTFSWASRRFRLPHPHRAVSDRVSAALALAERERGALTPWEKCDVVAAHHEDLLAKTSGAMGTSLAGAVVTDDLAALDVLTTWPGVDASRVGVAGFSGGGGRAAYLAALDPRVRAVVVTCMMATFASLVPEYVGSHSWLLFSPGLPGVIDLPDLLLAQRSRQPADALPPHPTTLVQYATRDDLFPLAGMREADRVLRDSLGESYTGSFHPVPHSFGADMQREAQRHLLAALGDPAGKPVPPQLHPTPSDNEDERDTP